MTQALQSESLPPALQITNIAKSFGGARALKGISFEVAPREVHGLLGQNGSGKSTLVKILAGFHAPDPGGSITLFGRPVPLPIRSAALRQMSVAFVHQNLGLVPSLTVLENLRVAAITARKWAIDWAAERRAARAALDRFGIDLDLSARLATLSQTDRALLAILRATEDLRAHQHGAALNGILVLDEPTPFLPREGIERLFALVRGLVAHGASVVFISHDIDEVRQITDRATILRDGEVSGTLVTSRATHDDFVEGIVGRRLKRFVASRSDASRRPVKAAVRGIAETGLAVPALDIHAGEVLGLTGLIGSGYERIPYLLFGATTARGGTLAIDGKTVDLSRIAPKSAIARGMALLPADRPKASGVSSLAVLDNLLVLDLPRFMRRLGLKRRAMAAAASDIGTQYEVRPNNPALRLGALSGGNAQKVLLAKWITQKPKLLMLDEPTQGVDVGTRQQVFKVIKSAAGEGAAVLCASSDFEQLADICDRVLIFARGEIVHELVGDEISKENIAEHCYGQSSLDSAENRNAEHQV